MSNEIQANFTTAKTLYFQVRNATGSIWNTSTVAFESYLTANIANYKTAMTEQGTASQLYAGTFPTGITTPGQYNIVAKQQAGGSPAETDVTVAMGEYQWNGAATLPLSDLATSGQIGQVAPIRLARGTMIQNFPIYLKSAVDHATAFTSGVVSGQVSRDGGAFGALQSGTVAEVGLGFYKVSLTSGDTLANTLSLLFTANGISGGASDPLPLSFLTQRTSGQ